MEGSIWYTDWFNPLSSSRIDVSFLTIIEVLTASSLAYLFTKFIILPLDLRKDLYGSGYQFVTGSKHDRINQINTIRRNRKIGEIPPVFPNGWFAIAESSHVPKGKPLHVSALGENFAVFRGEDGQCHVLDASCPHLGANMAIGGRIIGNCIECPFHRWQFDGRDGKCSTIPFTEKIPKFAEVKRWDSLEMNDLVFVHYNAEGESPTWAPEEIPEIKSRNFIYRGRNEFFVNAHIQQIPENGSDLVHFSALHSKSVICGGDITKQQTNWLNIFTHNWESVWHPSTDPELKHIGISKLLHHIDFCGFKLGSLDADIRQVGPGYVELKFLTPLGRLVITQTVTPIEPLVQKVVHRVYTPWQLALYGTIMLIGESVMFERDVTIWNHQKYLNKPLLMKEDKSVAKYRRWFSQFYSTNSPTYTSVKRCLEW
ncbi:Rieske [2Fe-2S] domain [Nesidiocoris tenuis]|uniref:cholesterol 7-desaturase n=1 Tax=Nesidiocoris tenuis TaxID=355587 RepID=A0ABN7AHI5_9HEMI|nr:Rieske [2Fe-2S] domain [Nesidiocoris tenuis]